MRYPLLSLFAFASAVSAWLPHERDLFSSYSSNYLSVGKGRSIERFQSGNNKLRGVNLGSLFIIEPWMASREWSSMGCGDAKSEFDCVMKLGQDAANEAFQKHWETYITEEDLDTIKAYGLNTIRVPVGYWIVEDTVYRDSEHLPQGGLRYLDRLAGWAAARDIYVILDLHGAPGAQEPNQPFTGQFADSSGFFQTYQYDRAYQFLTTMTERIHTNDAYRTTGMLEVLNEPERNHDSLVSQYYATAYSRIRDMESELNVADDKKLTVQFMDASWGAGNPRDAVGDKSGVAYDDHRYLKWAPIEHSKPSYISTSCSDTFQSDVVVGEWSLAVDTAVEWQAEWDPTKDDNKAWYKQWWAAQVQSYEKGAGWVFWSWKTELGGDWRWSYKAAVEAGVISKNPDQAPTLSGCGA